MPGVIGALFALAIGLCPPGFRREYGAAMREDFAQALDVEFALHGWFGAVLYGCEAILDLLTTALREYAAMFFRDFFYAFRALRKTPSFTAVVVLTLALAIGANAAVFSVLHAVALAPLPYAQPDRLFAFRSTLDGKQFTISLPDFATVVHGVPQIERAAAFTDSRVTLSGRGMPRKLDGIQATPDLFTTLAVRPLVGRFATAADATNGAGKTVVISENLYRSAFGGDSSFIGSFVKLDEVPYKLIGVVPKSFQQPRPARGFVSSDFWTVVPIDGQGTPFTAGWHAFDAVGRLAPGESVASVSAAMQPVVARMSVRNPANDTNLTFSADSLTDSLIGNVRALLFAMFAAVSAVLLVACANVANLLLSRAASREREFSVRIAVGASRGRIVAQLLVETFALAIVGGAFGIGLAYGAVAAFVASDPPNIPRANLVSVDAASIAYTLAVVAFCTIAAGLAPAFTTSQKDVAVALKSAGRGGDAHRGARVRNALVTCEIAMTLALVIAAGLVVRSFLSLTTQPLGFDSRNVSVVGLVDLPDSRYEADASVSAFMDRTIERIRRIPGAEHVAWAASVPYTGTLLGTSFTISRQHVAPGHEPNTKISPVTSDYFAAMGETLLAGRTFSKDDRAGSAPVVIVSESFARTFFAGRSPLGAYIVPQISTTKAAPPLRRIVGVVSDVKTSFTVPAEPLTYLPLDQLPSGKSYIVIRALAGTDPGPAAAAAISELDPLLPKPSVVTLDSLLAANVAVQRLTVVALCVLALVALALSVAGVFAVVSYGVTQRTHEFGVRMALGADARQIVRMVVFGAMRLAIIGIVLGLLVAGAGTRLLRDQLFDTQPLDPITFGTVTVIVLLAALVAAIVPARRATRVDPIIALRYE